MILTREGKQAALTDLKVSADCEVCQRMYWNALQMAQQHLDRLWEELQRVEQKLEEQEAKIEAAMKAKELPELIVLIEKKRDRLVEEEKDLRQQLGALQAQLACVAGEVLAAPHCPMTTGTMSSFQVCF